MEEAARFVIDDADLVQIAKSLRHDLVATLRPLGDLEAHRAVHRDVGCDLTTPAERTRSSVADVAVAAGKRLGEALRAIEEYAKTLDVAVATGVERLRYRGYELEQRLNRRMATGAPRQWAVCVLVSEALCAGRDWCEVAVRAAEGGADCIQIREKDMDGAELLERTEMLLTMLPEGTSVVVNDRVDVALAAGAHGVHLGQRDLPVREARRIAGRRLIIGVSAGSVDDARVAWEDGADYCGVGAMFETTTKRKPVSGPGLLRDYLAWNRLPHLAIGGITPDNLPALVQLGCRGVAVSAAICGAEDPAAVASTMREMLEDTRASLSH